MSYYSTPEGKDPQLWRMAQKRASFKSHLIVYLAVNTGLWILWLITGGKNQDGGIPWPAWSMFGWGIGLLSHYIGAYHSGGADNVEKEYDRLTQNKPNK